MHWICAFKILVVIFLSHILLRKWDTSQIWDNCFDVKPSTFSTPYRIKNMDKNLNKDTWDTNKDISRKFYYCHGLLSLYQREIWRLFSQRKPCEMFVCTPRFHVWGYSLCLPPGRMVIANRKLSYYNSIQILKLELRKYYNSSVFTVYTDTRLAV